MHSMPRQESRATKTASAAAHEQRPSPARERLQVAMLEVSGEVGYRNASVGRVLERSGGHRSQFYSYFRDRADCFTAAHATEVERLCSQLLGAGRAQPSWREGLRAGLAELVRFAIERPLVARGILREVYVARGPALVKHEEVLERLTHAVDSARREIPSRQAPPPMTASFMVGAVDELVRARLAEDDPQGLSAAMPELMSLLVAPYLGDDIAREELARSASKR